MTNPNISIYNHATGETEVRPMTDAEFAFSQQSGEMPADYTVPKVEHLTEIVPGNE